MYPPLRVGVELGVLDRLRDLGRDRDEQVDLGLGVVAGCTRADVQRALHLLPGEDGDGEDRLVLVLGQVRELLEAGVEVRRRGDRDRSALRRGGARDPLAEVQARAPRHLVDRRSVGGSEHQLVGALVVEVDEARIGPERISDLARDERQHLLEIERRVDRSDGLGQQSEVPCRGVHRQSVGRVARRP